MCDDTLHCLSSLQERRDSKLVCHVLTKYRSAIYRINSVPLRGNRELKGVITYQHKLLFDEVVCSAVIAIDCTTDHIVTFTA